MVSPNSRVRLLSNVPLTNRYEHQMDFPDKTTQYNYFNGLVSHPLEDDFKYQRAEQAINVALEYDSVYDCNYLMFQNTNYTGKWFYAFITRKEYVNPNTTRIYFEADVWQTWQFDINFKSSFVEREHRTRWNADGTPVVNTVDEGLNYGTDYKIVSVQKYIPHTDIFFLVVVSKAPLHDGADSATPSAVLNGSPQPLNYYILPFRMDDTVPLVNIDGALVSVDRALDVLNGLFVSDKSTNNIVSLYVTNFFGLPSNSGSGLDYSSTMVEHVNVDSLGTLHVKKLSNYQPITTNFGGVYDDFDVPSESKLYMHPYCTIELTDFRGNTIEYKPQYIKGDLTLTVRGSLGTDNKIVYSFNYNSGALSSADALTIDVQFALIDNNPNDIPILTDYLSAYLQGNRNQLKNDANGILFHAGANAVGSALAGVGSAMSGNAVGVVDSVVGAATGAVDSVFKIQGLNAKLKDISNVPPSISKMGSNTAWDYGNGYTGVYLVKKQITGEYQKKITDFFNMFGYKLNEVKVPNLKTRSFWNYVKTVGALIYGNVPSEDLGKIRQMFNNGVTLWHDSDVGNYARTNSEV